MGVVICINREFGCGAGKLADMLSSNLQIKLYDKDIMSNMAQKIGIDQSIIEANDEPKNTSMIFSLLMGAQPHLALTDVSVSDRLFKFNCETIREIAQKENCLILGRCGNHILKDFDNVLSVFICADNETKIKNVMETYKISKKEAGDLIKKNDKKRSSYYNYYTNSKWEEPKNYCLVLNTSKLDKQICYDLIKHSYDKLNNGL